MGKIKLTGGEKDLMVDILECWEGNRDDDYVNDKNYNAFLDKLYKLLEI